MLPRQRSEAALAILTCVVSSAVQKIKPLELVGGGGYL